MINLVRLTIKDAAGKSTAGEFWIKNVAANVQVESRAFLRLYLRY